MNLQKQDRLPLVFDDEPLDGILYGHHITKPTPADCFLPIKKHMRTIRDAYDVKDQNALLLALATIIDADMALHGPICDEIVDITETLIPNVPLPVLPYDIVGLTPLFERIWKLPSHTRDYTRKKAVGDRLYRCYEHQHRYADARRILHRLIRLAQARGDRSNEAVYTNNLAFEYLLEQRWQDGMPLFQRAEKLFFHEEDHFQSANARANYLTCISSFRPAHELAEYEKELNELALELSKDNDWRARKPYVLLSKIRESLDNLDGAIRYMHRAINASTDKGLRWTEIDKARLSELESKR